MSALCLSLEPRSITSAPVLSPLTRQILGLIKAHPGISKRNLECTIQAKGRDTAGQCLRALIDMNEIEMRMVGTNRCYWAVASEPPLLHAITNEMIRRSLN